MIHNYTMEASNRFFELSDDSSSIFAQIDSIPEETAYEIWHGKLEQILSENQNSSRYRMPLPY